MFNMKSMLPMISDEYQAFFQKRQEWRESLWEMEGMCYPWTGENGCKNFEMWSHCNFLSYAFPLFIDRILKIKIIQVTLPVFWEKITPNGSMEGNYLNEEREHKSLQLMVIIITLKCYNCNFLFCVVFLRYFLISHNSISLLSASLILIFSLYVHNSGKKQ